jgi:hypothetical protein
MHPTTTNTKCDRLPTSILNDGATPTGVDTVEDARYYKHINGHYHSHVCRYCGILIKHSHIGGDKPHRSYRTDCSCQRTGVKPLVLVEQSAILHSVRSNSKIHKRTRSNSAIGIATDGCFWPSRNVRPVIVNRSSGNRGGRKSGVRKRGSRISKYAKNKNGRKIAVIERKCGGRTPHQHRRKRKAYGTSVLSNHLSKSHKQQIRVVKRHRQKKNKSIKINTKTPELSDDEFYSITNYYIEINSRLTEDLDSQLLESPPSEIVNNT